MKVSSPISQPCSIHAGPTGRNRRKMLVYSCAHSQAGERGKKPMDRFQERGLKAEMQAALPSPWAGRDHEHQGWEPQSSC